MRKAIGTVALGAALVFSSFMVFGSGANAASNEARCCAMSACVCECGGDKAACTCDASCDCSNCGSSCGSACCAR